MPRMRLVVKLWIEQIQRVGQRSKRTLDVSACIKYELSEVDRHEDLQVGAHEEVAGSVGEMLGDLCGEIHWDCFL